MKRATWGRLPNEPRLWISVDFEQRAEAKSLPGASWNARLKLWTVAATFESEVEDLCRRLNGQRADTRPETTAVITTLFTATPERLRKATYLGLARAWHPDAGGDLRLTQQLTEAYASLGKGDKQ